MEQKRPMLGEFILLDTLGTGATAKVKLAYHPTTLASYAIKILKPAYAIRRINELEKEITILSALKHQNIVNLIQVYESIDYVKKNGTVKQVTALVFELVPGGDLFEYIMSSGKFSEDVARTHFRTLIETVQYCHDQGITHRDLKPENLLFDGDYNLKVADFGFATLLCGREDDGKLLTYIGTEAYMAPEILARQPYNGSAIDIFACGIILFVMISGYPPFEKAHPNDRIYRFLSQNMHDAFWARHESNRNITGGYSADLKNLINGMLSYDPAVRLTIAEIKAHPWYTADAKPLSDIKEEFNARKTKVDERLKKEKQRKEDLKKIAAQPQTNKVPMGIFKGIKPFRSSENLNIEQKIGSKVNFDAKRAIEEHQRKTGFKPFSEILSVISADELLKIVVYACESTLNEYIVSEDQYKIKGRALRDDGRCELKIQITKVDDETCCVEFHRAGNNSWVFYRVLEELRKKTFDIIHNDDDTGPNEKEGTKKVVE